MAKLEGYMQSQHEPEQKLARELCQSAVTEAETLGAAEPDSVEAELLRKLAEHRAGRWDFAKQA